MTTEEVVAAAEPREEKTEKKKNYKKATGTKHKFSKRYKENASLVDDTQTYSLSKALEILAQMKKAKFDETVELHINTTDKGLSGNITLPYGTGKQTKFAIINPAKNPKAADDLIAEIQSGKINFDILIATPDAMQRLGKVAKVLGPRGLMPNPKAGTISAKPEEAAEKYAGGQINFKTESKLPLLHLTVGKISFGKDKLEENIKEAIKAVQPKNIKNAIIKSTMSTGIRIQI